MKLTSSHLQPAMVPQHVARDPKIKPHAARLYMYLLTCTPEDGELFEAAEAFAGLDKETTEDAVNELINLGHMDKTEIVKNGKTLEVNYTFIIQGKD